MQGGLPESLLAEIGIRAKRKREVELIPSPTTSKKTSTEVAEEAESTDEAGAEPTEEDGTRPKFGFGDVVEADMWNEQNDCWQTRHRAIVCSFDRQTRTYLCKLPAYDDDDEWSNFNESQLHVPRSAEPDRSYNVGDKIHFHWAHRRVNGRIVDGHCSEEGVWVLGIIRSVWNDDFVVEHHNWAKGIGVESRKIERSKLRSAE